MSYHIWHNADEVMTLSGAMLKQGKKIQEADLSFLKNNSVVSDVDGKIIWIGASRKLPKGYFNKSTKVFDCKGGILMPGFVECHTHSVFSGSRADEFELRNRGVSYLEISKQGGGILSTMRATRKETESQLIKKAQYRVNRFIKQGVTTLEVKSGYALNLKDEIKMLKVNQQLKGPQIVSTFLGAHALPPEFDSYEEYLKFLLSTVLPFVKKKNLASRVDIFIEKGFFEKSMAQDFLKNAKEMGFHIAIHADQLTLSGGTNVAIQLHAQSADHVICLNKSIIKKLSHSNVTATLLPMADLYMKCPYPPARQLIDSGVRVALSTDFNPGSCPSQDLALVGLLARLQMKMTLPEVIAAYTVGGSFALGLEKNIGSIEMGKSADLILLNDDWRKLFYSAGEMPVAKVWKKSTLIS